MTLISYLVYKLPFSHDKKDVSHAIEQLTVTGKQLEGILFSSSKIGLMGMETIINMGLKIPEDLAIVSFDDPDFYKICFSPVTAIAQPLADMAKKAVRIVTREIETGMINVPTKKIVMKSILIVRKSSGN